MKQLASTIRDRLETLTEEYEQRLRAIKDYAELPDQVRREAARYALKLIASYLEGGNDAESIQFAQTLVSGQIEQGLTTESVMQALTALEETLIPLITSAEAATFLWRALSQARTIVARIDTTERVRAEETLREQKKEQQLILDTVPAMVWFKDAENRILRLNKSAAEAMGLSVEEVEGKSVYELNPDEADHYHQDDLEVINSGKPKAGIIEPLQTASGEYRWLRTDKIPYRDEEGNIIGVIVFALDITERKQAEQSLEEQQAFLRQVIDLSPNFVFVKDREGRFVLVNQALAEAYGTTVDGLIGKSDADFNPNLEEVEHFRRDDLQVMDSLQEKFIPEEVITDATGNVRWLQTIKRPLVDEDGTSSRMLGVASDITERKQAEQLLEEQQAFLRQVIDLSPNFVFVKDREGRFVLVNQALAEAYGTTVDGLIGKSDADFNPNLEEVEHFRRDDLQVMDSLQEKFIPEEVITDAAGNVRWLQTIKRPLVDEDGTSSRMLGVASDITARRQAEEESRRLARAVEATHDAVVITDANGSIQFINPAFEQTTGYSQAKALGENPRILKSGHQPDAFYSEMWQTITSGQVWQGEVTNQRKDGTLYEAQLTISPIRNAAGEIEQFVAIQRDVTKRKRLEQSIRESLEHRGRQVQISTEVAQEIAAAPALDELFHRVVTLIKERFDYYHAQIFRYDPAQDAAVLVVSYGQAGQNLLAEGHRLAMGRGVVGTAAATGQSVLATDVTQDPDWVANPHLPETKGELAVPIILRRAPRSAGQNGEARDEVLGILDVQSDTANALSEEDQLLLEGLCGQIAIAIEDTRLRQEMEENLRELNAMYRVMSREGWEAFRETTELPGGYLFDRTDIQPADDLWVPEIEEAVAQENLVPPAGEGEPGRGNVVSPLSVRGEIIGALGIYDDPERPLSPEDLALVELVSEQVAMALESARLFEQTQTALAQTEAVYNASQSLITAGKPKEMLRAIATPALEAGANVATLFYLDTDAKGQPEWAEVVARIQSAGTSTDSIGTRYYLPEFPLGRLLVASPGQPKMISDVGVPHEGVDEATVQIMKGEGIQAGAIIPLTLGQRWVGVVMLSWPEPHEFSPQEQQIYGAIGPQLAAIIENQRFLEQTQRRAVQLQAAAEVSRAASSILALDELLPQGVELIRNRFNLYYVGIFLVDEAEQYAVLQAGTGEAGQQMLAAGHRLEVGGESMIGWCVANKQARIALDVGEEAVRFDNPFLPETRSEMALPLISRGEIIGAMTVQSLEAAAFSREDITVLQTMSDQVAAAIENVRLLAEAQSALQEVHLVHQHYLREEWEGFLASRKGEEGMGYVLTQDELKPMPQIWSPEIQLAMQSRQSVVVADTEEAPLPGENGDSDEDVSESAIRARSALAAPITLRGQVIGALDIFDPDQPREWTDDDLALVDAVTSQVGLAVENARLFEQTQGALAETEALYRASRRIISSTDLPALYQILVDEMASRLGADQCQLVIFEQRKGYGHVMAEYLPTPSEGKSPIPIADNPSYAILRDTQRPLAIEDVSTHSAVAPFRDRLAQQKVKSMLLVPIVVRNELIGSLEADSVGQKRAFTETELGFCQTLASQAAITIDNMRAFEEQKQTAERLREIDKFKTQFLANMSHELRTPLNSIIGFSRVILKGIDGPLTELQQTDLTAIYNSGQHLLGLINDILDLSKIEAGKMELNFEEVDLAPIVKGVMSTAVGLVKDRPIELEHHVTEGLPTIWADATRVRQVLLNLVSNATKFTESGIISLTADYDDEWVSLSVTDTGMGIPKEKVESIFEEFTQVDGSTTRRFGGTGLGLPISAHFVEMHGGKIIVESEEGVGSTFTIVLPIHAQTEPKTEQVEDEPEDETQAVERQLVLAVDDDPGVISLYRRYLEGEGYHVVGIASGDEVLDKASELQPFAITLDVLMPTKDGWQVLRELKECPQTQDIPIIICSIVNDEGRGFSMGAADYLVKPIMEEDLLTALSRLDQQEEEAEVEVLVIDDQADDILLIRRILEAQTRYRVIGADGGQAGIDMVNQRKPDIIILDLMMPGVDGFAVLETLKREADTRNIPVIVVTAKVLTDEEVQHLMGQVEVLLHKGLFTEHELLEDLGKALSQIESAQS